MEQTNPLNEFITDETYNTVKPFLDEVAVRDYLIRKKYRRMRFSGMKAGDAVDKLREEYPHLQWDTLRKIAVSKM